MNGPLRAVNHIETVTDGDPSRRTPPSARRARPVSAVEH